MTGAIHTSLLLALILWGNIVFAQETSSLEKELQKGGYSLVLFVPASNLEEHPLFSPDGDYLGFNSYGKWKMNSLNDITISGATWLGMDLGYNDKANSSKNLKTKELESYKTATKVGMSKLILSNNTVIELQSNGFGTSLIITPKGEEPKRIWTTGMEPCFNLAVGSNENLIAFMCPMSGMFIMDLKATLKDFEIRVKASADSESQKGETQNQGSKTTEDFLAQLSEKMNEKRDLTEEGDILLRAGKPEEAIKLLNQAVEKDPHNARPFLILGYCYAELGKHQKALENFTMANQIEPSQDGVFNMAMSNLWLGNLNESIKYSTKAIAMAEDDYAAYNIRALAYMTSGEKANACLDYKKIKKAKFSSIGLADLKAFCK